MKKAIVIGGTGMVGTQLIKQLIENETYSEIVSLVRRGSGITHPKLFEHIVNFDQPESWSYLITGDVLFSTLGTTIAQAKTKEAQFKVDYTYQFTVAKIAAKNGVSNYVLISSAGANSNSKAFYMRMKGQLEDAVQRLPFKVISLIRPGQLAGNRTEKRIGEKIGLSVMHFLNKLGLFKRYKPILAYQVAQAMINANRKETIRHLQSG
ncbi:MAG TPA: NAD(P)H-binding protein [Paludibacter sp.]|nr:NAD(P)H-binding protein [Paludibacter sp.]